jgi:hypothetical protein
MQGRNEKEEEYNGPGDVAYERESAAGCRSVCLGSTQGLEALGGGSFEEVVRPPLGNCSLNTPNRHIVLRCR